MAFGERETERERDRDTEGMRYRDTGRQRYRETERQRDRETERQRDRETERQRDRVRGGDVAQSRGTCTLHATRCDAMERGLVPCTA